MRGETVSQMLDRVLDTPAVPRSITVNYGTELRSQALEHWPIGGESNTTSFYRQNPWSMPAWNR